MKIHYRMQIEMTSIGQSFFLKSSKGEQFSGQSREKVADLCDLLNESDVFSLFLGVNEEISVGIKPSLRGLFNQLLVKSGFQKPLSKSNFSNKTVVIDNIELNVALREIKYQDKITCIAPCSNLDELIAQLQKAKL